LLAKRPEYHLKVFIDHQRMLRLNQQGGGVKKLRGVRYFTLMNPYRMLIVVLLLTNILMTSMVRKA
jgi:hypothetical protein